MLLLFQILIKRKMIAFKKRNSFNVVKHLFEKFYPGCIRIHIICEV